MTKGGGILLTILLVAATVGLVVWAGKKAKASVMPAEPDNGTGGTNTGGGSSTVGTISNPKQLSYNVVLKRGSGFTSYNAEVKQLQRIANKILPANPLVVDGLFGPKTEDKVKQFNNGFGQITLGQLKVKYPWY